MRYRRISVLLLSFSIVLWTISVRSAELKIGDYGLIHSLRPEYFISLFLLTVSFLFLLKFEPQARLLLGIHLVTFALFLILPAMILEGTPRGTFTYLCARCVESIENSGHIYTAEVFYLKWPGLHILGAELTMLTGIGTSSLMFWFPLLLQLLLLPIAAFLFRQLCSTPREFWTAMWLIVLFPPLFGNLFLPMNTATLLLILAVGIILWSRRRFKRIINSTWVIMIPLLASLTMMHALTSLVTFMYLFLLFTTLAVALGWKTLGPMKNLVDKVREAGKAITTPAWEHTRGIFAFPLRVFAYAGYDRLAVLCLCGALIVAWQFLGIPSLAGRPQATQQAVQHATEQAEGLIEGITSPESRVEALQQLSYGRSEAHTRVVNLRILYGGLISFLAIAVFLRTLMSRRIQTHTLTLVAWVVIPSIVLIFLSAYGGEMLARAFWYATPWLCVIAARSVKGKVLPILLVVILFVSPMLLFVFRNGNEVMDYTRPSEIATADFFSHYRPARETTMEVVARGRIWEYELYDHADDVDIQGSPLSDAEYVVTGEPYEATLSFFEDIDTEEYIEQLGTLSYSQIYGNRDVRLLMRNSP